MTKRDEFTRSVRDRLRQRVDGRCSNPDCDVSTSAGSKTTDAVRCLGDAAHIRAAAPGGKRYDASMTSEQRRAFDNGLWLCTRCARLIDTDEVEFHVAKLVAWKADAEERA